MNCPYCGSNKSLVIDKRNRNNTDYIWRRRKCLKCEKRFSTQEKVITYGNRNKKRNVE